MNADVLASRNDSATAQINRSVREITKLLNADIVMAGFESRERHKNAAIDALYEREAVASALTAFAQLISQSKIETTEMTEPRGKRK